MAELSAETQAIVERLQAEGKLLRNSGSNSIRSVKVELSKFEGIFNTISTNIASQTDTMRASMSAQEDIAEREREQAARQRAFDDLEADSESAELKALREKVETQKLKNDLASEKDKAKGPGLFSKLSSMGSMKTLIGGALGIGALTIGYGYLNAETDGGLDKMVKSIRDTAWDKISKSMNLIAEKTPGILTQLENALKPENLEALAKAAGTAAVAGLGIGAAVKLAPSVLEAATTGYLLNEVRKAKGGTPGSVDPDDPDRDRSRRGSMRPTLKSFTVAGLATYALSALMPKIGDYIRGGIMGMTPTEIANKKYDAVDFGGTVLKYSSIGLMFGPKGALVGAGIGAAIGIGEKIVDVIRDDLYDEGAITNRMEDALEEVERIKTDAEDKLTEMIEKREELSKNLTEAQLENIGLGNDAIQAQRDIVDAEKAAIAKAATEAAQQSARQIQTEIDELTDKEFRAQRQRKGRNLGESDKAYARAKAEFDKERLDEIMRLQGQQNQTIQTAIEAGADPEAIQRTVDNLEMTDEDYRNLRAQNNRMMRDMGITRGLNDIIDSVTGASTANQAPIMMQTVNNVVGPTTTYNGGSTSTTTVNAPLIGAGNGSSTGLGG